MPLRLRESGIDGLLLDIDGTLMEHDRALPGAADVLAALDRAALPYRLLTNTTRRSRAATAAALARAGLDVPAERVLTPAVLARRRILESGRLATGLLVEDDVRNDLAGVDSDAAEPAWVVVGDLGAGFTFARLNAAFLWLRAGAQLLALHKNPWWDAGAAGPVLDAGAFVVALEFATGRSAEVVGKPAPAFFQLALAELGLPAERVLVVGDDADADGAGAAAVGCPTALVLTGKGASGAAAVASGRVLASIGDLLA